MMVNTNNAMLLNRKTHKISLNCRSQLSITLRFNKILLLCTSNIAIHKTVSF